MGLKILHSADWHLDSPFAGFSESQRRQLKAWQRELPGKIARLCRQEGCDLVLLAGDIFDGIPGRDTLERVKDALAECAVPVMISPGNHDFCGPGSPWLREQWPENVFVFTGRLESVVIGALSCRVYGAGYRDMDCPPLLEGFRAEGEEAYRIAVLHGDPMQADSPYCPVTAGQVRTSGLDYIALGHIHRAGAFQAGRSYCAWPGCPMGRGWDETGDKGVCIVTIGDTVDIRAVGLNTLRFFDLEAEIEGGAEAALENILPAAPTEDFYRVTLTGYGEADPAALRRRYAHIPNLELRDRTQDPVALWDSADQDSLEGIYFSMLRRAMDEDPDSADTIRLAAEISRKLLSGREVTL